MSFRDRLAQPDLPAHLPANPYCLSLSCGDMTRAVALAPALFWTLVALLPVSLGLGTAGAAYFLFHDAGARAFVTRAAEQRAEAQDRLAAERGRFDAANSRRLLDEATLERRLSDLLTRQARLEQRDAVVTALAAGTARAGCGEATAARPAGGALQAIEALSPAVRPATVAAGEAPARDYAPLPVTSVPRLSPTASDQPSLKPEKLSAAAANPDLDIGTRLDFAAMALDRVESGQMISLAAIDRAASDAVRRKSAILTEVGLEPGRFASAEASLSVPLEVSPAAPAFDRAAARVARDVATAVGLGAALPHIPLRKPLFGDATVTSPFGYRADPFLGRPMLHAGVDLREPYGAEIHATAAGRVVHAGPMGGYGDMVEIDHGDGLTTRYGHMSELDVQEGQEVGEGAGLGRLGSTGRSTGPHLHYEVRIDGEPVDPERFLRAGERLDEAD
jgi:murein DD-endopeptidase MepM/ murein hydrolase activator NlpD